MVDLLIYALRDPRNGQYRYVGLSTRGMARPETHLRPPRPRDQTHRANWLRNLLAEGVQPEIIIVEYCASEDELSDAEEAWIALFREMGCPLTNHLSGGFSGRHDGLTKSKISASLRGRVFSDAHTAALSASKIGSLNPMFGQQHTDETRLRMSAARIGEKNHRFGMVVPGGEAHRFAPGHKVRPPVLSGQNHPMFGSKHSLESRQKMSESKAGQPPWNKGIAMPVDQRERLSVARTGKQTRCGVCGELGHNKQTCAAEVRV